MFAGQTRENVTLTQLLRNSQTPSQCFNSVTSSPLLSFKRGHRTKAHRSSLKRSAAEEKKNPRKRPAHIQWSSLEEGRGSSQGSSPRQTLDTLWNLLALWEVVAFPLRPAIASPSYYDFSSSNFMRSALPVLDVLGDLCYLINLVKAHQAGTEFVGMFRPLFWMRQIMQIIHPIVLQWIGAWLQLGLWPWQLLCLPRFLRALSHYQRSLRLDQKDAADPELRMQEQGKNRELLKFLVVLFTSLHYIGCILFTSSRLQDFSLTTWVGAFAAETFPLYDVANASGIERYIFILHKGADAMTLAGVNFTPPQNNLEALLYCFSMVAQIFMVAYILGTLFHSLVVRDERLEAHLEHLAELQKLCNQRQLPKELHSELQNHFKFQYDKQNSFQPNDPSMDLPKALKLAVAESLYGPIVDRCSSGPLALFRNCKREFIREILLLLREEHLRPGEAFVVQDEMAFELSFLSQGTVDFIETTGGDTAGGPGRSGSSGDDNYFKKLSSESPDIPTIIGELSFFVGIPQVCTVRVTPEGAASRLVLLRDNYKQLVSAFPEEHQNIMQNIVGMYGLDMQGNDLPNSIMNPFLDDAGGQLDRVKSALKHHLVMQHLTSMARVMDAAIVGQCDEVLRLIRLGLDVNTQNFDGQTALHISAAHGSVPVVQALLEEGCDMNRRDRWGCTALQEAVRMDETSSVRLLDKKGCKMFIKDASQALCNAASEGNPDAVAVLLKNGVSPDVSDYDKRTALHVACAAGHDKVVDILIQKGAEIGAVDRWGGVPLYDAVKGRHTVIVHMLRAKGAQLNVAQTATELCSAADEGDHEQLNLLRVCGVDMDMGDYDTRTALMLSAAKNHLACVSYLICWGVAVNKEDRWGNNALCEALKHSHPMVAQLLVSAGARLPTVAPGALRLHNPLECMMHEFEELLSKAFEDPRPPPGLPPLQRRSQHARTLTEAVPSPSKGGDNLDLAVADLELGILDNMAHLDGTPPANPDKQKLEELLREADLDTTRVAVKRLVQASEERSKASKIVCAHTDEEVQAARVATRRTWRSICSPVWGPMRRELAEAARQKEHRHWSRAVMLQQLSLQAERDQHGRRQRLQSEEQSWARVGPAERELTGLPGSMMDAQGSGGREDICNSPLDLDLDGASAASSPELGTDAMDEQEQGQNSHGQGRKGQESLKQAAAKFQKLVLRLEDVQRGWTALSTAAFDSDSGLRAEGSAWSGEDSARPGMSPLCEAVADLFEMIAESGPAQDDDACCSTPSADSPEDLQDVALVPLRTKVDWTPAKWVPQYSHKGCPCKMPIPLTKLQQLLSRLGIPVHDRKEVELMMREVVVNKKCHTVEKIQKGLRGRVHRHLMEHARLDLGAQRCSLMEALAFGNRFRRYLLEVEPTEVMVGDELVVGKRMDQLTSIRTGLDIIEEMYTAFAGTDETIAKTKLLQLPKLLGEVGSVVFSEMVPLQELPDEVTKADFYVLVSLYANGHLVTGRRDIMDVAISGTSQRLKRKMSKWKMRSQKRMGSFGDVVGAAAALAGFDEASDPGSPMSPMSPMSPRGGGSFNSVSTTEPPPDLNWMSTWAYLYQLLMVLPGSWYIRLRLMPRLQGWWLDAIVEELEEKAESRMKKAFELTTRKDALKVTAVRDFMQHLWRVPEPLPEWMEDRRMHFLFADVFNASHWSHRARFMRRMDTAQWGLKEYITWAELQAALADHSSRRSQQDRSSKWKHLYKDTVLLPDTWLLHVWHRMILFIYMFNFSWVPMRNCFNLYPDGGSTRPFTADGEDAWLAGMDVMEVAFDLILLVDVVVHLNTAIVNEQSILITDRNTIRAHYTSNGLLLDVGCVAPLNWLALALGVPRVTCGWLRMNRLVGIFNVIANERRRIEGPLMDSKPHLAALLFLIVHVAGCVWYFLGNVSADSWYNAAEPDEDSMLAYGRLESSSIVERYLLCFYWCFNIMMSWAMVTPAPGDSPHRAAGGTAPRWRLAARTQVV
ncbi:hypothetical protein CYMTET_52397 [Cymbomonas tetramitiformis]|uniref:Cyclic nucleotide-binding domain-containing protein n=1 Tax=Cymbomonas tetramitiformis TaxID=36881 RepID=A0AAE0BJ39_9CHLO|nr:hypothetical protein CYMTET_52397 [Cymbomonas tetramitiformis]